jgi:hypothetical protein
MGIKNWVTTVGGGLILTGAQSCAPDEPISPASPQGQNAAATPDLSPEIETTADKIVLLIKKDMESGTFSAVSFREERMAEDELMKPLLEKIKNVATALSAQDYLLGSAMPRLLQAERGAEKQVQKELELRNQAYDMLFSQINLRVEETLQEELRDISKPPSVGR